MEPPEPEPEQQGPLQLQVHVRLRPHLWRDGRAAGLDPRELPSDVHVLTPATRAAGRNPTTTSQADVFAHLVKRPRLVAKLIDGVNSSIFAFGATGAGKSYSLIGPEGGRQPGSGHRAAARVDEGVLPRLARELFMQIHEREQREAKGDRAVLSHQLRLQFLECYQERVYDLLASSAAMTGQTDDAQLQSRQAVDLQWSEEHQRVYAKNAAEIPVNSVDELLEAIALGTSKRATAATSVHAHSSRSHAIIQLIVEKRWRVGVGRENQFRAQVSYFTIADLAGAESVLAHDGVVDKSMVLNNQGLLTLGMVLSELARPGAHSHVRFRDSKLTHLLQNALSSGRSITHMLCCVAPIDDAITHRTIEHALNAARIDMGETVENRVIDNTAAALAADPMLGDVHDPNLAMNRRCIWIRTDTFGDVFARVAGNDRGPLILYIHGSGPSNSSLVWVLWMQELEMLAAAPPASASGGPHPPPRPLQVLQDQATFFHVAIDCPGYGRSCGDRQSVRSYPAQLVWEVMTALQRQSVFMLVGSSQGAAASVSAAVDQSSGPAGGVGRRIHSVVVVHPVVWADQRATPLQQPLLMLYDVADAGHPVAEGREFRKQQLNGYYYEFSSRAGAHGDFEDEHLADVMLDMMHRENMLGATKKGQKLSYRGGRIVSKFPELTREAGGYNAFRDVVDDEVLPKYWGGGYARAGEDLNRLGQRWLASRARQVASSADDRHGASVFGGVSGSGLPPGVAVESAFTPFVTAQNTISYRSSGGRVRSTPPTGAGEFCEVVRLMHPGYTGRCCAGGKASSSRPERALTGSSAYNRSRGKAAPKKNKQQLFDDRPADAADYEDEDEAAKLRAEQEADLRRAELEQRHCDVCSQACLQEHHVDDADGKLPPIETSAQSHRASLRLTKCRHLVCADCARFTRMHQFQVCVKCGADVRNRLADLKRLANSTRSASSKRVIVLEYGNDAQKNGSKTKYTASVRLKGAENLESLKVTKVDFNINPDFARPTATHTSSNGLKSAFVFGYTMARAFPCYMTVHFNIASVPPLLIEYYHQPANCRRRMVLELAKGVGDPSSSRKKAAPVKCDPHLGEDGDGPPRHWLVSGYGAKGMEEASMSELAKQLS